MDRRSPRKDSPPCNTCAPCAHVPVPGPGACAPGSDWAAGIGSFGCNRRARAAALPLALALTLGVFAAGAGCVNVQAPERVTIGDHPSRIDSSQVPPTNSHEEARQRLAEAYARNRYLEAKVDKLEREKRELRAERDECERRYERIRERSENGDD